VRKSVTLFIRTIGSFRIAIVVPVFMLSACLLALASCGGTTGADSVALEFAPGYTNPSSGNTITGLDEEGSVVLRCASFVENEQGIIVTTSRSKNMKANSLIFMRLPEAGSSENNVQIASAPIIGEEYDYDMTQAKLYEVTVSSAEAAIKNYGISYLDWQAGAYSTSEQFPCCE